MKACEGERGEAVSSARFSLVDKVSRARRAYTKQRADKRFTKQYGSSESATCRSDAGAPRAAVYKTEMGVSHKKAARMQGSAPSSRGGSAASKKRRSVSPKLIVSAAIAACMLFSFVFLYEPAKLYYQEVRERDRLQAEYALIAERNEVIQDEVDVLSTTAGIEDRAHEEFGWVNSGESTANVIGVEVEDTSSFTASVVPGSVEAPDTWYSFLDSFFGVEK